MRDDEGIGSQLDIGNEEGRFLQTCFLKKHIEVADSVVDEFSGSAFYAGHGRWEVDSSDKATQDSIDTNRETGCPKAILHGECELKAGINSESE